MDAVLNWVWQGVLVALGCSVALRVMERAPARVRYTMLWGTTALVLVLPLLRGWLTAESAPSAGVLAAAADAPVVSIPVSWWTSSAAVLALWVSWCAVHGLRLLRSAWAVRRVRRDLCELPEAVSARLASWSALRTTGRAARLGLSSHVQSAAVVCGAPPVIAIAPTLLDELSAEELDSVVVHEWTHVQRRDDLVVLLQLAVRAVAGWHPAIWWLDRRLQIEREAACDERVVALTGAPRAYAACLTRLASRSMAVPSALPALGAASSSGLGDRVTRILRRGGLLAAWQARGMAAGWVLALCTLVVAVGGVRLVVSALPAQPIGADVRMMPAALAWSASSSVMAPRAPDGDTHAPTASISDRADETTESDDPGVALDHEPTPELLLVGDGRDFGVELEPVPVLASAAVAGLGHDGVSVAPSGMASPPSLASVPPPWRGAADAGVALARGSKEAGTATAGFFARVGKRIASSF